jgi:Leucine-rich repeat (LRR) protein
VKRDLEVLPDFSLHTKIKDSRLVKTLAIDFTPLNQILSGIGKQFTGLEQLLVHAVTLRSLKSRNFVDMPKLKKLDMSQVKIKFIEEDAFWELRNLEEFICTGCGIVKLPVNLFNHLKKLKVLSLRENKLVHLGRNLFTDNSNLEQINLSENPLTKIDVDFTKMLKLSSVDLSKTCVNSKMNPQLTSNSSSVYGLQNDINHKCKEDNTMFRAFMSFLNFIFGIGY